MYLNSSEFESSESRLRYHRQLMTVQKKAFTYSAQRDESAGCVQVVFWSLTRGSNMGLTWTREVWPLGPTPFAVNMQGRSLIFSCHDVGLLDRGYLISWGTWHPPQVTIGEVWLHYCNFCRGEGPWDRLKLSKWVPRGVDAFLACWDTVIDPVCQNS